jgi:hypothetical protein
LGEAGYCHFAIVFTHFNSHSLDAPQFCRNKRCSTTHVSLNELDLSPPLAIKTRCRMKRAGATGFLVISYGCLALKFHWQFFCDDFSGSAPLKLVLKGMSVTPVSY